MKKALFIGRFQPFHNAHLKVIKDIMKRYYHIIIAIGYSRIKDVHSDPFTATERKMMINKCLRAEGIKDFTVKSVPDIPDDNRWASHTKNIVGKFDIVYTGNKLTCRLMKKAGNKVKFIELYPGYSGTKVRKWIAQGKKWQKLVPEGTIEVMKKIKGIARIKKLAKEKKESLFLAYEYTMVFFKRI